MLVRKKESKYRYWILASQINHRQTAIFEILIIYAYTSFFHQEFFPKFCSEIGSKTSGLMSCVVYFLILEGVWIREEGNKESKSGVWRRLGRAVVAVSALKLKSMTGGQLRSSAASQLRSPRLWAGTMMTHPAHQAQHNRHSAEAQNVLILTVSRQSRTRQEAVNIRARSVTSGLRAGWPCQCSDQFISSSATLRAQAISVSGQVTLVSWNSR